MTNNGTVLTNNEIMPRVFEAAKELDDAKNFDDEWAALKKLCELDRELTKSPVKSTKWSIVIDMLHIAASNSTICDMDKFEDGWQAFIAVAYYHYNYVFKEE